VRKRQAGRIAPARLSVFPESGWAALRAGRLWREYFSAPRQPSKIYAPCASFGFMPNTVSAIDPRPTDQQLRRAQSRASWHVERAPTP
jgi:hypothetical protein